MYNALMHDTCNDSIWKHSTLFPSETVERCVLKQNEDNAFGVSLWQPAALQMKGWIAVPALLGRETQGVGVFLVRHERDLSVVLQVGRHENGRLHILPDRSEQHVAICPQLVGRVHDRLCLF